MLPPTNLVRTIVPILLVAGLVAGCGSSKKSSSSTTTTTSSSTTTASSSSSPGVDSTVAAQVPSKFKSKTIVVAADATYAPNEFIASNGHTVVGMDPDLAQALSAVMGTKVKVVNATFDSIIPGLASGKYDLGMSSFTDTKARQKVVDFVTYFSAGTSFYVKAQGGPTINSLADLCGHTVGVERGTTQATDATAQSATNLAISSGRAQVGMADSPVAAYIVKQSNGQFKLTGTPYNTAPYGIAITKGSGLDKPVLAALKVLMKDGKYKAILTKWNIEQGAITNPKINGAIS
jgi:polar amino acid transport system substrate-binding protein